MYAALDFVVDKCERQLTKLKEKLREHKGHMSMAGPVEAEAESTAELDLDLEADLPDDSRPPELPSRSEPPPMIRSEPKSPPSTRPPKGGRGSRGDQKKGS